MDADIFVSGKKKLRIQKYPDTCGRGLILSTVISLVGFSTMFGPVNFDRACVVGETVVGGGCAEKCTALVIFHCEVLEDIRLTIF